jgi:hypothetical protein
VRLRQIENAKFVFKDVLQTIETEQKDVFILAYSVRKIMPEQHPIVRQSEI